ncbi:MAG: RNA pyrophosphohydrolase [Alphaproteobacteria bacterium]|nr:RNA pyrophosphohydrolase [Alphaproteobacteria bacterium]
MMVVNLEKLPYRLGVGIILFNIKKQVFVGQRFDMPSDAWQMPQGGIDKDEHPVDAAWREMIEEIGTKNAAFLYESKDWYYYDLPQDLIPKLWQGRFKGQKQKWFAFKFLGQDGEINIHTSSPEFKAWQWVDLHQTPDLIVPFKKNLYQNLVKEFNQFL